MSKNFYIFGNKSQQDLEQTIANTNYQPDTNVDVKPGFTRRDHESWRPAEMLATKYPDIMRQCRSTYDRDGLVKSIIDLMVDMVVEGLEVVHSDDEIQKFFTAWSKKVGLLDRAEKFANHLLVEGNVVVRRIVGRISSSTKKEELAGSEIEPNMIPVGYVFYDPASIDIIGNNLALYSSIKQYGLVVSTNFLQKIANVDNETKKKLLSSMPNEVKMLLTGEGIKTKTTDRGSVIPIPSNRVYVTSLKKRDCDPWAKGPIYSILSEILYNHKLRLAKLGALDGWNNTVRLWKLGDHTLEIFPDSGAFAKLASILQHNVNGNIDILWDSLIKLETFYPPIEKLERFEERYENILIGLGIPKALLGGEETSSNIPASLRNFIKRINAIRRHLLDWLDVEIGSIVRNLNIDTPPVVRFNYNNLFDQSSYFKILVELYDRNVISDKTILDKIGESFNLERLWSKEEYDLREKDKLSPSTGPFYQPLIPKENQETQQDTDLIEKDRGPSDVKRGRRPGAKDVLKRKRRMKSLSSLIKIANSIQDKLDLILDEQFLSLYNIDNKRKLTSEQKKEISIVKTSLLASLSSDTFSEKDDLLSYIDQEKVNKFIEIRKQYLGEFEDLSMANVKLVNSMAYAELNSESDNLNENL